jgi:selenophosphate synthase
LLTALASLSQHQQQLAQNYIPSSALNNNNSIATSLQQLAQLNASANTSPPKFDDMLRKAIAEFGKQSAWTTTTVQTPR